MTSLKIAVPAHEIQPCFTLLVSGTCGKDDDVGALAVRVVAGEYCCRLNKGEAMIQIHGVTFGKIGVTVDQDDGEAMPLIIRA